MCLVDEVTATGPENEDKPSEQNGETSQTDNKTVKEGNFYFVLSHYDSFILAEPKTFLSIKAFIKKSDTRC